MGVSVVVASAYPDKPVDVLCLEYCRPLYLTRESNALTGRTGKDAMYVVPFPYWVHLKVRERKRGAQAEWITIDVPHSFLTDLASVPRGFRWFAGRVGRHLEASVVHDWLYVAWQKNAGGDGKPTDERRRFCDDVLLAGMKAANVCWIQKWGIFWAVRTFGRCIFRNENARLFA